MKVKELIARLNKFDQELEVVFQNKVCELHETCIADTIDVKYGLQNPDCEFYYWIIPNECNSPEYPELKIQQLLVLS